MKKILIMTILLLSLTSCGRMTPQEIEEGKIYCDSIGESFSLNETPFGDSYYCTDVKMDPVIYCIKEYTRGIDEKYNNPDNVSNLREENYSEVVKTCNDIFGNKK